MPVEVILPKVDMDMTHGTLAVWHVAEGESVAKGAALFDIETDKAAMEVEAPASGVLRAVSARPGDRVAVGSVVAQIYAEGEVVADPVPATTLPVREPVEAPPQAQAETAAALSSARKPDEAAAVMGSASGLRATPAARAAARAAGVDLADISGSGPLGRIQRDDVAAREVQTVRSPDVWVPQPGALHMTYRRGDGVPVVMIHGFAADSQSWAPLEKAIGPTRALIRIDLPGHGRSPHRRLRSFADLSRAMQEAFDEATRHVDLVHLLGHSLGAAVALSLTDVRSRRVASLSMIAPAGLGPEIDAGVLTGITRATHAESLAPWLRCLTANPDDISDDYVKAAMRSRTDPALRAVQAEMAEVLFPDGVQVFDLRPAMSRLKLPACMIWGRRDRIIPSRHALAADGECAIHMLTGVGHVPQIEAPDRVALILKRHLSAAEVPV